MTTDRRPLSDVRLAAVHAPRWSLPQVERSSVLLLLLVLVLGFLVVTPIGLVVWNSFVTTADNGATRFGLDAWVRAFSQPGMVQSILNTLKVAAAVQLISLPLGVLLAWLVGRTDIPGRRWLEFGFWLSFLMPALGTTTGWILVLGPDFGVANLLLRAVGLEQLAVFDIYSYWGIIFVHLATFSISVKVILLAPAFRNLDSSLDEASRICGASTFQSLRRVVLPVLTPAIVVVFLMALIRSLEAFEIELVLGRPIDFSVYSTKMFQLLRSSPADYSAATVLATGVLLLLVPMIVLQRWLSTRRSYVTLGGRHRRDATQLGRWRWPAFVFVASFVFLLTIVPVVFQAMGSLMTLFGFFEVPRVWTFRHWTDAFSDPTFGTGVKNTLIIGLGTVVVSLIVFPIIAYSSVRLRQSWRSLLDTLSWLPFAIPGLILGLGVLWLVLGVPIFRPIYGSIALLVIISCITAITLAVQLLKTGFMQLGSELEEAAQVTGASWLRTIRTISVPLIMPVTMVVGMMVFAGTVRAVATFAFLITGETQPLSVLQLNLLYGSELGQAAVVGTVIVVLSMAFATAARFFELRSAQHG